MTDTQYFCAICTKLVHEGSDAICCDYYDNWVHRKCNLLNIQDFRILTNSSEVWSCLKCNSDIFPFNSCPENFDGDWNPSQHDPKLLSFFRDANSTSSNDNNNTDEHDGFVEKLDCKYFNCDEFKSSFSNCKGMSFLHLNIIVLYRNILII